MHATSPDSDAQAAQIVALLQQHSDTHDSVLSSELDASTPNTNNVWRLVIGDELPCLYRPDGVCWSIDFRNSKTRRRAAEQDRSQQPLARALGISKLAADERSSWHVLDGTAGAGSDGWQIAAAGASVTWVEQHPVLFTLLDEALRVATEDDNTRPIAQNIQCVNDTIENVALHQTMPLPANAIYLDPMYPVRRSKAAVKKPMQFIQALVGGGPDAKTMLTHCLEALNQPTVKRVVVKRPSEASPLIQAADTQAQLVSVNAGAARFDVYLNP